MISLTKLPPPIPARSPRKSSGSAHMMLNPSSIGGAFPYRSNACGSRQQPFFSGSHPTYRSAIFPFIFEHAQLDTRCFSISETYGKASPFACRKTLCFMQSPGH